MARTPDPGVPNTASVVGTLRVRGCLGALKQKDLSLPVTAARLRRPPGHTPSSEAAEGNVGDRERLNPPPRSV